MADFHGGLRQDIQRPIHPQTPVVPSTPHLSLPLPLPEY